MTKIPMLLSFLASFTSPPPLLDAFVRLIPALLGTATTPDAGPRGALVRGGTDVLVHERLPGHDGLYVPVRLWKVRQDPRLNAY